MLAGGIESALGSALLAPLRDDAGSVRLMAKRDRKHLLGRRHLEIQRQGDLGHQPVDVVIGDVAAVFAEVGGDSVGSGVGRDVRCTDGVRMVAAAVRLGAPVVEFPTGSYAHAEGGAQATELKRIADCAGLAVKNGIEPHAGHGLTFDNVIPVAAIPRLAELNIGHFLIGEAIFTGLDASVRKMRSLMDSAR